MRTSPTLATLALAVALAAPLSACVVADDEPSDDDLGELGDDERSDDDVVVQERRILNGVEPDAFWNRLTQSRSSMEKLRTLSFEQIRTDATIRAQLADLGARELMRRITRCAMAPGWHSFSVPGVGTVRMDGSAGLAPAWTDRALTPTERQRVSGCVLALVNAFGSDVWLDMRGEPNSLFPSSSSERAVYDVEEASFFGDIFTPDPDAVWEMIQSGQPRTPTLLFPDMYSCWDGAYRFGEQYIDGRLCGFTVCVATPVGSCQDVCSTQDGPEVVGNGDNDRCTGGWFRTSWGWWPRVWHEPVTTFLTDECALAGSSSNVCAQF